LTEKLDSKRRKTPTSPSNSTNIEKRRDKKEVETHQTGTETLDKI
jgi:hypothetical protein